MTREVVAGRLPVSRPLVFLLLVWAWTVPLLGTAAAERLPITTYGTGEGLAGYVENVLRDSRGFLWFGTRDGISRFDGVRFVNYGSEHGLSDPTVNDAIQSRSGDHWIATNGGGVCRLTAASPPPERRTLTTATGALFSCMRLAEHGYANRVNTLFEDARGQIWAGTDAGLFRLGPEPQPQAFTQIPLTIAAARPALPGVSRIISDGRQGLWLGTSEGLVHIDLDGRAFDERWIADTFGRGHISTVLVDAQQRLWVGQRGGVQVVHLGTSTLPEVRPVSPLVRGTTLDLPASPGERRWMPLDPINQWPARSALQTTDGDVWLGSINGLVHVTHDSLRIYTVASGLASNDIRGLAEDQDGNLWIASNVVMKLTRRGFVTYTMADGLGDGAVHGIFETRAGQLQVTTGDWLINALDGPRFTFVKTAMADESVRHWGSQVAVLDRSDRWWLLAAQGLWRLPAVTSPARLGPLSGPLPRTISRVLLGLETQATARQSAPPLSPHETPMRLHQDRQGAIWVAFAPPGVRLVRWEPETGRSSVLSLADGLPDDRVSAMAEDAHGQIWIGFQSAGVVRVHQGRVTQFTSAHGLPHGGIMALHSDDRGRLWIGTSGGGAARVDDVRAAEPQFVHYTAAEGLGSNNVRSIISDRWHRVYFGTARGVDRLDPATGHVRHYTTRDGLALGLATATYRDTRGRLWFGTTHGLSRLDPAPDASPQPPPVWIGALRVAGVTQPSTHLGTQEIAHRTLGHRQNQLDVEFFGLTFAMGDLLRYQYRLEGADRDWGPVTSEQRVHYSALAPGEYRFMVRAVTADGVVSARPATAAFTILPPPWQRAWFRILVAGFLGIAVTIFYRARVRRLIEIERVRTRIASDLHDDIGSNLSRIAILSEVAKRQLGDPAAEPARHLTEIADSARTLIDSLSDIVWSIDPRHDDLGSLIVRVRAFAADVLGANGVKWSCMAPPDLDRIRLRPDMRRHLLLMLKEGVTNIARHAEATTARLRIEVEGSQLIAELADDGRGFLIKEEPEPRARGGHGLSSMRWRAAELGGILRTISAPGAGTCLHVIVPLRASAASPGPHAHAIAERAAVGQDQEA